MSKKDFIALAIDIMRHNEIAASGDRPGYTAFTADQIEALAGFCRGQNPLFNRERWLSYIAGECGPNGGPVKKAK